MIDIHSHVIPFVDDGAEDFDEFLNMASMAVSSGVDVIVATPHSNQLGRYENYDSEALQGLFHEARGMLKKHRIPLTLLRGMEIFLGDDEWEEKLLDGLLLPLNGSDNYLVEFAFDEHPRYIRKQLERMLSHGKTPVIAHPERYYCVQDEPELVEEWLRMGCLTQINKGSVFNRFGSSCGYTARYLLDARLVTCVGSDAHASYVRTPHMGEIRRYLAQNYSYQYMEQLLEVNPHRIVFGEEPDERTEFPEE